MSDILITTNDMLELYHRISENEQELNDILTVDDGETNIKYLDLQLVEKLEWNPNQSGEYNISINDKKIKIIYTNLSEYWKLDEGDKNIGNNFIGKSKLNLNIEGWDSSSVGYNKSIDCSEDSNYWISDEKVVCNTNNISAFTWTYINDITESAARIFQTHDNPDTRNDDGEDIGWNLFTRKNYNEIKVEHFNNSNKTNVAIDDKEIGNYKNKWIFWGYTSNGDSCDVYMWDKDKFINSVSGEAARKSTNKSYFSGMAGDGRYINGNCALVGTVNEYWNKEQFEKIWNITN